MVDMSKEAMFNGVPFGGVGRVMTDYNVLSDGRCECQHLLFEGMVAVRVGSSCVAQHEDDRCIGIMMDAKIVPPPKQVFGNEGGCFVTGADGDEALVSLQVVNAVRNDLSRCKMLIIMVIDFDLTLHEALARPVKVAQTLFFLAIDADNRAVHAHGKYQAENDLKLLLPFGISTCGQVFALLAVLEAHQAQFDFDLAVANWDAVFFQENPGELFGFQMCPKHAAVSRAARFMPLYQGFQQGARVRGVGKIFSCHLLPVVDGPLEFVA